MYRREEEFGDYIADRVSGRIRVRIRIFQGPIRDQEWPRSIQGSFAAALSSVGMFSGHKKCADSVHMVTSSSCIVKLAAESCSRFQVFTRK